MRPLVTAGDGTRRERPPSSLTYWLRGRPGATPPERNDGQLVAQEGQLSAGSGRGPEPLRRGGSFARSSGRRHAIVPEFGLEWRTGWSDRAAERVRLGTAFPTRTLAHTETERPSDASYITSFLRGPGS